MNLVKNNKKNIVFAILEAEKAYTEKNFFEGFINCIKNKYEEISFINHFSINGNIRNSKKFIDNFFGKLKSSIKSTNITKKIDFLDHNIFDYVYIFCIWDKSKQKSNFEKNYNLLKKYKKNILNIKYECLIFKDGIEKDLFAKFFKEKILSIKEIIKKIGYKSIKDFKSRSNWHLFYNILEATKIKNDSNVLVNIKKRLYNNGETHFVKMLDLIEKLND